MKLVKLNWDSDFFGFPIGKITDLEGSPRRGEILCRMDSAGFRLVYIETELVQPQLQSEHVVDQVTLRMEIDKEVGDYFACVYPITSHPCSQPDDELVELAIEAGWSSRFRIDCRIAESDFRRLYEVWIARSCLREVSDTVIVAKDLDRYCGFVTGKQSESDFKIGLIAVSDKYRRRGIGRQLLDAARQHAVDLGCSTLSVVTQSVNHAALSLYESFGFRIRRTTRWYHVWNDGRQD